MHVSVGTSFLVLYYKSPTSTLISYCMSNSPFTIGIQGSLRQHSMLKHGHKKVVSFDAMFATNDNKVYNFQYLELPSYLASLQNYRSTPML